MSRFDGMRKTVYVRNILSDLWAARKRAAVFVVFCMAAAGYLAVRPAVPATLSDEQKEELAAYQEQMEEYDAAIRDLSESIENNKTQISQLKDYIDQSIYMQIDPDHIKTAVVQYSLKTEANTANILNSFLTYINDGGLKEAVGEEDEDLQPEYWRDIISCSVNSNILNVTVIHYDEEKCARIMEIVKKRIREHEPEVKAAQGEFTLTEMETSQFEKADPAVVNGQNGHRNNLKNYESGLADLRNRRISYRTNRANYRKNNEPSFAETANEKPDGRIAKYLIAGILVGAVGACAAAALRYILSDRLRSAAELRDFGLNVLGICRAEGGITGESKSKPGDGSGGLSFMPEAARAAMDIRLLAQAQDKDAVYMDLLCEDGLCKKAAEAYAAALSEDGMTAQSGSHAAESAEELKAMIKCGTCLLFAEAGKTTYQDLRQHTELCRRFRVAVLGCVVIE